MNHEKEIHGYGKAHLNLGEWTVCMTGEGAFKSNFFFFKKNGKGLTKGPCPGATISMYIHTAYMHIFPCGDHPSWQINIINVRITRQMCYI